MTNWINAARPKTLLAGSSPVILGLAISFSILGTLNYVSTLLTLLCAVFLQISTNLINDYYDGIKGTDTEERLGPQRATASGLISSRSVKRAFTTTMSIAFLLGIYPMYIGGTLIITIGLISLFFAWAYTGGPYPLSYFGLGEVFAFLFFGPVAVFGTYYIQYQEFNLFVLLLGFIPGFMSALIMSINNLRDFESDSKAHKFTLAVLLGVNNFRTLIFLILLLAFTWPIIIYKFHNNNIILLSPLSLLLFLKNWKQVLSAEISSKLNKNLALTGLSLFIYIIALSVALIV